MSDIPQGWQESPEGIVQRVGSFTLRVGHRLDSGGYAYFVHKEESPHVSRGEASTREKAVRACYELMYMLA